VLAVGTRTLGAEHPDTLIVRYSIAREMAARGDHAGAEEHFREVFAARQQALGQDHPDTLITWFSIAQEMAARGDHAGAEAEYRGMLPHLRRRLGPDHPDTLATRFSIAQEMAAAGDHAGAEEEFRAVLPYLEHRLGPDHPHTRAAAELINDKQGNRSPELGQKVGAGAHIENDDTAVTKCPAQRIGWQSPYFRVETTPLGLASHRGRAGSPERLDQNPAGI
jgi:hypothetical protein